MSVIDSFSNSVHGDEEEEEKMTVNSILKFYLRSMKFLTTITKPPEAIVKKFFFVCFFLLVSMQ